MMHESECAGDVAVHKCHVKSEHECGDSRCLAGTSASYHENIPEPPASGGVGVEVFEQCPDRRAIGVETAEPPRGLHEYVRRPYKFRLMAAQLRLVKSGLLKRGCDVDGVV